MMTPTDELLVQASCDGDRTAFATLVTRYRDVVVRVAYSRLGEFNSSEDIAQQTFVTAWNRKFDLTDPSKIAAWLCGIARNLVLNERRRIAHVPTDAVAALGRDWIGILFVIVLLSIVLTVFLPKVRQADTALLQSRATWQAAFAIFVGEQPSVE